MTFRFYGTGHEMDDAEYYVGTIQQPKNVWGYHLVWHLFVQHVSLIDKECKDE